MNETFALDNHQELVNGTTLAVEGTGPNCRRALASDGR